MTRWIIAYDITDDLRRVRVASLLLETGVRIQQSVYEVENVAIHEVRAKVEALIDPMEDAVLATPTCGTCGNTQWSAGQTGVRMHDRWWIA